jgi:hypothetical protein
MKSKALMILGAAAVLLALGALPGTRTPILWEYGVYSPSGSGYDWQDGSRRVQASDPTNFYEKMGIRTKTDIDAHTGRVPLLVLNHLGAQGWELFAVESDSYWFKRPLSP